MPPDPLVRRYEELQVSVSQADRAFGRFDGSMQTLPHPELFVAMYVRKEAMFYSQLEGTQSSLQKKLSTCSTKTWFQMNAMNRTQDTGMEWLPYSAATGGARPFL